LSPKINKVIIMTFFKTKKSELSVEMCVKVNIERSKYKRLNSNSDFQISSRTKLFYLIRNIIKTMRAAKAYITSNVVFKKIFSTFMCGTYEAMGNF